MISQPLFDPVKTCRTTPGSLLCSETTLYTVDSVMRQGTFGQVVKCTRMKDSKPVMIKMFKNDPQYIEAARTEVHILNKLRRLDPDKSHLVKWYQAFEDNTFTCLLFEHMDSSLLDLLKEQHPHGVDLKTIRPIIKQVASALYHLKFLNIIHADLKLENVLLVKHTSRPWTVKVFGFSRAHDVSAARQGHCNQCLPYQSPEIILGLPYNAAVDIWSLGCISAALYLGALLYPGSTQYEVLSYMVQTQGQPPDTLLNLGLHTNLFFLRDASSGSWRLKNPEEYFKKQDCPLQDSRTKVLSSLQDFLDLRLLGPHNLEYEVTEMGDSCMFVDLLEGMLQLYAAERLTPRQVVQHPFITMTHLHSMELDGAPCSSSGRPESEIDRARRAA